MSRFVSSAARGARYWSRLSRDSRQCLDEVETFEMQWRHRMVCNEV